MIAFIFCATVPFKFTVFGIDEVTFNVPEVMVNTLEIPNSEPADNCNEEPLIVALNKFAVPDNKDVPVKVTIPAVAVKVPLTSNKLEMEKLEVVVMLPISCNELKAFVPAPLIVLPAPFIIIVPVVADNEPVPVRLLVIVKLASVETDPFTVRSLKIIFAPEIDLVAPVIVIIPPDRCVNCPEPLVDRLPDTFNKVLVAAVIPEERKLISLKLCVPFPLMVVVGPLKLTVLVVPVKIPLFIQLPLIVCEKLPPLKVVAFPMFTFPFIIRLEAAVNVTDDPVPIKLVKFPSIIKSVAGKVFIAVPD